MIEIRCSSLPRILACPASQYPPAIVIEGEDEAARLGTAAHILCTHIVRGLPTMHVETLAIADEHRVDVDELRLLGNLARLCWDSLVEHFPAPVCEERMTYIDDDAGVVLTGQPDLYAIDGDEGRIPDFKTGRTLGDHDDQLLGYQFLLSRKFPHLQTFWGAPIHVRHREIGQPVTMTRSELDAWWGRLCETVKEEHYRPSHEACIYCPRRTSCPARQEMLRDAAGVLTGIDQPISLGGIDNDQLRLGVITAKHLAKICDEYLAAAKTETLIRGSHQGDLDTIGIDGLVVKKESHRELTKDAWPILLKVIDQDAARECAKLSVTKVEKAIGATAAKGQKSKVIASVLKELEDADALLKNVVEKLTVLPLRSIAAE